MTASKPLIGRDGEVRELEEQDVKRARRGRPTLPADVRKRRVQVMMDPDVHAALKDAKANISERVNSLLRKDLGL